MIIASRADRDFRSSLGDLRKVSDGTQFTRLRESMGSRSILRSGVNSHLS